MATMHSYALRMASLVLVSAFAFGAIAAVAIVRLQDGEDEAAETEPGITEIAAVEPDAPADVIDEPVSAPVPPSSQEEDPPADTAVLEPAVVEAAPAAAPPEDLFRQSFVSLAPEPEPEPVAAAPELQRWLDLPGMTPSLDGLLVEGLEVALADPGEPLDDTPTTAQPVSEPEPEPEPDATAVIDENCDAASPDWAMFLFDNTVPGGWDRVPNVRVVPMGFCTDTRQQLESRMQASGRLGSLRGAAAADQLVSLALSRASRGPNDVFAMATEGSVLNVYVY